MLLRLKIKNVALISENIIEFGEGFNVLTGETGAGKSLIIDSLNFVMGARADRSLIKHGEDFASVECVFEVERITPEIEEFFESINTEPENTIIITRYLNQSGRNDIKVNGETVTNAMLRKLTTHLVEIHGQHAHQTLLEPKNHLSILDSFNESISGIVLQLQDKIKQVKEVDKEISALGGDGAERQRNIELLQYQINEIEMSDLKLDEDEELEQQKDAMINSEKIVTNLGSAVETLTGEELSVVPKFSVALSYIKSVAHFDKDLNEKLEKLSEIYYELEDLAEQLVDKVSDLEFSEDRLNEIVERLDLIKSLKKKYGGTIKEVIEYSENAQNRLDKLINSDKELAKLKAIRDDLIKELFNIQVKLTETRKLTALEVEKKIESHLKDLGMKNANFVVSFNNSYSLQNLWDAVTLNGADDVEFMFSANLGEPVKPLSKIISGGEMSRFMLAVKCVLGENSNKTFIFDEIDNGIGGETGTTVAQKIDMLAKTNQIICVTHLAQIASFGDVHFKIVKFEQGEKTITKTEVVKNEARLQELSRLLGANKNSDIGLMHAKELLQISGKN